MKISGIAISSTFFISLLWKLKKYRVVSSISMEHKTVCFYYDVLLMVTVERPYENVGDMSQHNTSQTKTFPYFRCPLCTVILFWLLHQFRPYKYKYTRICAHTLFVRGLYQLRCNFAVDFTLSNNMLKLQPVKVSNKL